MIDIFNNYILQREELLARIAQELQLDKTRKERMESAYNAVAEVLKKDGDFFKDIEIEVYAQGSVRIGTTVKPINNEDFDLDTILHIYDLYKNYTPRFIYNELLRVLKDNGKYSELIEEKNRCIRINFKGDFHMDILPACMKNKFDNEKIYIPERGLNSWTSGNPKGYADWFLEIANSVKHSVLRQFSDTLVEAKIETEQLPEELYLKTPLQRAVQLIKRYRDIYFQDKDYPVSSIVITTLVASLYQNETSIYETIDNVLKRVKDKYQNAINNGIKFKVFNPVNPEEEFTDSWTIENYKSFYQFISDFYTKWQNIKSSFEIGREDYIKLFGEGLYKQSLNEQILTYSKLTSDGFTKASSSILSGKAVTDSKGNINENKGTKNEYHRNFGGKY